MNQVAEFVVGNLYSNDQIRFSLAVENLGGIRPAIDTQKNLRHIAVMTAAEDSGKVKTENPYHDRIEGDVLVYTAQGRQGDQLLSGRNKRLIEQYSTPSPFFGFINVGRQTYRFLGLLELLRHYQEQQSDRRGNLRKAWMFEFRIHSEPPIVPIEHATVISAELLAESRKQNPLVALEREVSDLDEVSDSVPADIPAAQVEDVRSHLLQIDPFRFEHLIKALMERNGFVAVSVTQAGSDGGIDINAYVEEQNDFFAGTHVQAQVKRWRHVSV
jgi:hypothetical protein